MKLFIESASVEATEEALDIGAVDGVVLGRRASAEPLAALRALADELFDLAVGPVIIDVPMRSVDAALERARELAAFGDEVACRLPVTRDGLTVCRACFDEGIATWVGPCASVAQALLAAKAGATWIGVDVGAVDAAGGDGVKLAEDIAGLVNDCDFEAQVLAEGVQHAQHVGELALAGVHSAAVAPELLWSLAATPARKAAAAPVRGSKRR